MQPITHAASQWQAICRTCRLDPEAATAGEVYIEVMRRGLGVSKHHVSEVCTVCGAADHGNAGCRECVRHWQFISPQLREHIIAAIDAGRVAEVEVTP